MTYTELVAAICSYTQNYEDDFVANIPTFVKQAEERIYNAVLLPALRRNVTGLTIAGNKYLACPNDFLAVLSMAVVDKTGRYEYLLNKDVNFMRAAYPNPAATAIPRYYSLFGPAVISGTTTNELSFILAPTPDDSYTVELHYYYYPTSIVEAGSSWLGDNYDPVLLYGSLLEAYIFMKGEADVLTMYQQKFNDAISQLTRLGTGLERGDTYRDGQAKVKVTS